MRKDVLNISTLTLLVVRRHLLVWLKTWPSALAWAIGEPLVFLLAFGFGFKKLIGGIQGHDYVLFLAPGLVAVGAMNVACYECTFGSFSRLEMIRAYDAIASTPVMPEEIAFADALWGALKSCIMAMVMMMVFAVFGAINTFTVLLALPALFFMSLFFASLSLIATSVAKNFDFFSYYFTVIVTPAFFFSGAFFPVEQLPRVFRIAAQCLPITHAVDVTRASALHGSMYSIVLKTLILAGVSIPAAFIAAWRMKKRIVK